MIIIGSTAIKHYFPDFPREPKDLDVLYSSHNQLRYNTNKEERIEYLYNPIITGYIGSDYCIVNQQNMLKPDYLYTLKASHLCWDINWEKHMFDIQFLLKKGCKIDLKLFWELYNYWNTVHTKNKRSDLKMTKDDFFTNAINYDTCQHDDLHKLLNPIPIYTKVLKDNCEVELDENKFNNLSFEDKLDFVREEVMVMAYERYKSLGFQRAYHRMVKKFILSHAPLFSLVFIIENYIELHKPKFDYIKLIENGRDN